MKSKKIIIGLLVFISILGILDLTLKIQYTEDGFYEISNLKLSDSILVESGQIFIGKNIQGEIEAVIFPTKYLENGKEENVEYIYMRFYPEWFNLNMNSIISDTGRTVSASLNEVKIIREENFRNYMHINKYPIVRKDYVPIVIKKKDITEKKIFAYNRKKH